MKYSEVKCIKCKKVLGFELKQNNTFSSLVCSKQCASKKNIVTISITKRQRDICELLKNGMTNKNIAKELNIGERTVETHIATLLQALHLKNKMQLLKFYLENSHLISVRKYHRKVK